MICEDCKQAADLPAIEVPPVGTRLDSEVVAVAARADRIERARIGRHERCRRREDGCPCQHGDHGAYRADVSGHGRS